jgi:hypothetical protein
LRVLQIVTAWALSASLASAAPVAPGAGLARVFAGLHLNGVSRLSENFGNISINRAVNQAMRDARINTPKTVRVK